MYDSFNRKINYLRISVTDRCNLRCQYCVPDGILPLLPRADLLTYEEIFSFTRYAVELGIEKVRITGGEPLVRRDIIKLVRMIASIPGIRDFGMTTNGILLDGMARELKKAGLHRVNISLDTMDPERFRELTRGGDINRVLRGIEAAREAGLTPIKINCVIKNSPDEKDARDVKKFCEENGLLIRYIRWMDLEKGDFSIVEGGEGGHCASCNRLRLTANGKLKPCLFSNLEYDIRLLGYEKALQLALGNKPRSGKQNTINKFSNIGG